RGFLRSSQHGDLVVLRRWSSSCNRAGRDFSSRPLAKGARTRQDRKSTRLNSSHRTISYAVFCLKKKIKQEIRNNGVREPSGPVDAGELGEHFRRDLLVKLHVLVELR